MLFGEEHHALRASLKRFVETEINPYVEAWEEAKIFPAHELFKKLGDAGFLGITKPVEYGGQNLDYSYEIVMAEELGHIRSGGVSTAIGVQTDMCTPALAKHGSDELRQDYLAPSIAGEIVGCIGVSEVGAGSDVASLKTYARSDGDDYIINGSKMWITNSTQADWMCLLCNTSDEGGPHKNKSLIVVPMDSPGITVGEKLKKLGGHASDTAPVYFDDVRIPKRNRIGQEGRGFIYQMEQFQEERLYAAAKFLSQVEDGVEETIQYTRERQVFGRSVLDNQVVHYKLAEILTEIEAARALTYLATEKYINGENVTKLASMAKYKMGVITQTVPSACLQFFGGQGFMWDNYVTRVFRDTRNASIGGGTNEIMLQIISKELGIMPSKQT